MQIFYYNTKKIRMFTRDDGAWYSLSDVCRALKHSVGASVALAGSQNLDKVYLQNLKAPSRLGYVVNYRGLYQILRYFNQEKDHAFKAWVDKIRVSASNEIQETAPAAKKAPVKVLEKSPAKASKQAREKTERSSVIIVAIVRGGSSTHELAKIIKSLETEAA
jgi:prophage antirepressor-like protein